MMSTIIGGPLPLFFVDVPSCIICGRHQLAMSCWLCPLVATYLVAEFAVPVPHVDRQVRGAPVFHLYGQRRGGARAYAWRHGSTRYISQSQDFLPHGGASKNARV